MLACRLSHGLCLPAPWLFAVCRLASLPRGLPRQPGARTPYPLARNVLPGLTAANRSRRLQCCERARGPSHFWPQTTRPEPKGTDHAATVASQHRPSHATRWPGACLERMRTRTPASPRSLLRRARPVYGARCPHPARAPRTHPRRPPLCASASHGEGQRTLVNELRPQKLIQLRIRAANRGAADRVSAPSSSSPSSDDHLDTDDIDSTVNHEAYSCASSC